MNKIIQFAFLVIISLNVVVDISHKILLQNIAFKVFDGSEQVIWISIINTLIIIPFLLLFSTSGFLSDRYPKNKIIYYGAVSSLAISIGLFVSYIFNSYYCAMGLLFLLAIQSAIYSPAKFGLIRDIYGKNKLAKGNSYVQSLSMMSILLSIALFSFLFEKIYSGLSSTSIGPEIIMNSMIPVTIIIAAIAFIEFLLAFFFFSHLDMESNKEKKFSGKDLIKGKLLKENIKFITNSEVIFLSVIGLSVFWGISQGMMATFPSFAKENLNISDVFVINGVLAASGIGIGLGSYIYGKISKNYINITTLPIAAIGIAFMIYFSTVATTVTQLVTVFFLFGIFGGLFAVPLNALIQFNSKKEQLGTVLAGNNWFQSLFMFAILTLTTLVSFYEVSPLNTIYTLLVIAIIGALYIILKLPETLIRFFLSVAVGLKYKLEVFGLKNIPSQGGALLLGNHVSWLDWAIIQLSMPRRITFVMDKTIYKKWFLNWIFKHLSIIPISGNSKDSMKEIAKRLDKGELVVLFPEGAITRTGHLGEFKKGFEKILEMTETDIPVIAFYIRGLWETMFSRANDKFKRSFKTNVITMSYSEPISKDKASAAYVKSEVLDLSTENWRNHIEALETIPNEVFNSMKVVRNNLAVADSTGLELSGYKFLTTSIIFKNLLKNKVKGKNIGLLVPSTAAGSFVNISMLMLGKTVININYTAEIESLIKSIELADVKTIVASKKFVSKLKGKGINIDSLLEKVDVIYLEDFKDSVSLFTKVSTLMSVKIFPTWLLKLIHVKKVHKRDNAFIMFSSGSEGTPKGIELTHNNILANTQQTASILNVNEEDIIIGSLPLFHAFGICVTTCLPLVEGIAMVAHPDPTDGPGLGKLVHKYKATIMCGTSTFFRLYTKNKRVHPLMFNSLRYIVAGAEKLNPQVKEEFKVKFGKDILEGYGTTETAPVASCNIPDVLTPDFTVQKSCQDGSVGMPVPGTSIKIIDPVELERYKKEYQDRLDDIDDDIIFSHDYSAFEGLKNMSIEFLDTNEEGMVLISGPQIMKGYLDNYRKTQEVTVTINDEIWYITGDKGRIDENGFLFIVDRYSRFAKLGGEMVSLGAVEGKITSLVGSSFGDIEYMCVAVKDDKKGEKLVLLLSGVKERRLPEFKDKINKGFENKLMVPSEYKLVDEIPKLGSGKKDFSSGKKLALS